MTGDASPDEILALLARTRSETLDAMDLLRSSRRQIEEQARQLESPNAVVEYIDFFLDFFGRAAADLERVSDQLPKGLAQTELDLLRQIASNAAAEQRRCLMFRDKWINKPLPQESMRPLLNQISTDSRDQLSAYRSLTDAAARLEALVGSQPKPPDESKLGRRELFTRWFGR